MVVFVAAYIPGASELRASVDIRVVSVVLTPACVLVSEVDIPAPPRFFALPKICSLANSSNSAEVVHKEFVDSPSGVRTRYGSRSNISNADLR